MSYSKLGLLLGDPSGIGPELCAKLLEERSGRESNRVVLIGEPSLFENGKKVAGIELEAPLVKNIREIPDGGIGMLQGPELKMEGGPCWRGKRDLRPLCTGFFPQGFSTV